MGLLTGKLLGDVTLKVIIPWRISMSVSWYFAHGFKSPFLSREQSLCNAYTGQRKGQ